MRTAGTRVRPSRVALTEGPRPVAEAAGDAVHSLERDVRTLMRGLAEARAALDERASTHRSQVRTLLLGVVEALDAFDRVLRKVAAKPEAITPQMKIWLGNFRTVRRLLERVLVDQGLVPIVADVGEPCDPYWHRATVTVEDTTRPEGAIAEVTASGWVWQGVILRKAEVTVVAAPDGEHPAGEID